jgi:hypothetical protein
VKFRFVQENRETFRVGKMCEVLKVSRSGYYAWRRRGNRAPTLGRMDIRGATDHARNG